jgi:hypothetical protein
MNDITNPVITSFDFSRFSGISEFWLRNADIFLYRDSAPRPDSEFARPRHDQRGWPFSLLSTDGFSDLTYRLFADRASLQQPHPLRFYVLITGICNNPLSGSNFRAMGGGEGLGPEHDASTIRSLNQAFRSFPIGWSYATGFDGFTTPFTGHVPPPSDSIP